MRSPAGPDPSEPRRLRGSPQAAFSPSWARPFRSGPAWLHDTVAVTPLVGTLLILGISTMGITAVLLWGLPNIQQSQAVAELEGMYSQFETFQSVATNVIRGGAIGKASEVSINIPKGQVQRVEDSLLTVSWFHNRTDEDDAWFWFSGVADDTPSTFSVFAGYLSDPSLLDDHYIQVWRVYSDTSSELAASQFSPAGGFAAGSTVQVTFPAGSAGLYEQATRILIGRFVAGVEVPVMEAWFLPMSSLEYVRDTSFGLAGVRLENNVVISTMETGDFMRTQPLGTRESADDGDPVTVSVFTMQFIDNATYPGVEAAGGGSYPLLFALRSNTLRADGVSVDAFALNAYGPHSDLWLAKYDETFGMQTPTEDPPGPLGPVDPAGNGLVVQAPLWKPGNREAFSFVLLESLVEVTLKVDVESLGPGV